MEKVYLALCHGALADEGRLDTPYGRHPRDRTRFTGRVDRARAGRVTEWRVVERFGERRRAGRGDARTPAGPTRSVSTWPRPATRCWPTPCYGGTRREARLPAADPVRRAAEAMGRQALHAARLAFDHPRTGRRVAFEAPLPADLARALAVLREAHS